MRWGTKPQGVSFLAMVAISLAVAGCRQVKVDSNSGTFKVSRYAPLPSPTPTVLLPLSPDISVSVTINGSPISNYSHSGFFQVYKKVGYTFTAVGSPITNPNGLIQSTLPDLLTEYVIGTTLPNSLSATYSAPLTGGAQTWDIQAARVTLSGTNAPSLVNTYADLHQRKNNQFVNLWKKAKISSSYQFLLALPDTGGPSFAAVNLGPSLGIKFAPIIAGDQIWNLDQNRAPTMSAIPNQTVEENGRLVLPLYAWDIDDERVYYLMNSLPSFAILKDWGDQNGTIVLRPKSGQAGTYNLQITLSDGKDVANIPFTLTVTPALTPPAPEPTPNIAPIPPSVPTIPGTSLSGIWVNNGEDKVTKDELRASRGQSTNNSVWDGSSVRLFAAKNEVVSFNLVLEAAKAGVTGLNVKLDTLVGPNGTVIRSRKTTKDDLFNFVGRNIELFYVNYLQILGLCRLGYNPTYDERHIPIRLQRPHNQHAGYGLFTDRPDAYKYYPDIAVPIEAVPNFEVKAGENQSIWTDIYVPKNAPAGSYIGNLVITEQELGLTKSVPISLSVMNFALPDAPSQKTMLYFSEENITDRYLGTKFPNLGSETTLRKQRIEQLWNEHHLLAHRHKISLIDGGTTTTQKMNNRWVPVLNGELFTPANGYDGPGVSTSSGIYSIGTYSAWRTMWSSTDPAAMAANTDLWVNWFSANLPGVEYFIYLFDEPNSSKFAEIQNWASWVKNNPGPGKSMQTFVTKSIPNLDQSMPSVDLGVTSWGPTSLFQPVQDKFRNMGKKYWAYNGERPMSGSYMIEDEGVAFRVSSWTHFKHKIDRWFYWESTHYKNTSYSNFETNVFKRAQTFGRNASLNAWYGETGTNYMNGDGVLFYPGTDRRFAEDSYDILGPIASLRLKHWRRGVQDVDYLTMAAQIDPVAVNNLVQTMIPKVLWEVGVTDMNDPTWVRTDISWSVNPDVWEQARKTLADIILSAQGAPRTP